nr:exosortase F system-associated protein [Flavobacterium sp. J372]
MQKKRSVNIVPALAIVILVVLLAVVRFYQEDLFYDPLVPFFKTDSVILPFLDIPKLLGGLTLRYLINTVLSLGILWFCFKDKKYHQAHNNIIRVIFHCTDDRFHHCCQYRKTQPAGFVLHPQVFNTAFVPDTFYPRVLLSAKKFRHLNLQGFQNLLGLKITARLLIMKNLLILHQ